MEQNNESEVNLEGNDLAGNMARWTLERYGVDDYNDPAPEIIPILSEEPAIKTSSIYQEWDSSTIYHSIFKTLDMKTQSLTLKFHMHQTQHTLITSFISFLRHT